MSVADSFLPAVVEAHSVGVRSGKGLFVLPAFTTAARACSPSLAPRIRAACSAVKTMFSPLGNTHGSLVRGPTHNAEFARVSPSWGAVVALMGTDTTHVAYSACEAAVRAHMGSEATHMAHPDFERPTWGREKTHMAYPPREAGCCPAWGFSRSGVRSNAHCGGG